jgi:hypothetical protein
MLRGRGLILEERERVLRGLEDWRSIPESFFGN